MLFYISKRLLLMIPTMIVISAISFIIIQLPPGDFATSYISALAASGAVTSQEQLEALRATYGLDQPVWAQYVKWITGILTRGDFGIAFQYNIPVAQILWERVWMTVWISLVCVLVSWIISFPIGFYSAVKQYFRWGIMFLR